MKMTLSFQAIITEVTSLTKEVLYFKITCPQEFTFQAGQFVVIFFTKNGETKPRAYSILNPPSEKGVIELIVKLIPGGFASEVWEKLKKGDVLQVKGASGNFSFHENNPEQWFIGAGTGVVPLYSMIKEYLPQYPQKKFRLFFGLRSKKDLFLVQELDQLKKRYTHFDYLITLSREKWDGPQGWVQKHLGTELTHKNFYICGRKELAFDTKAYLVKHKVEEKNIYFEAY